jgi:serine protease
MAAGARPAVGAGAAQLGHRLARQRRKGDLMSSLPRRRFSLRSLAVGFGLAALVGSALAASVGAAGPPNSTATVHQDRPEIFMKIHGAKHKGGGGTNLTYHGGTAGVGVVTGADKVYLVYWGSQWTGNDPSGEAAIQQGFFNAVGGSSWNASVTQYCQGVSSGTVTCGSSGTHATNPTGVLGGTWYDNAASAPSRPSQSQLAAEAIRAAAHFANTSAASNTTAQYVINTATGNNAGGFGSQYCAWHSSTSSSYGNIAYTNMPYITDAGASCGAGFNGLGPNAGITIVGGHEFAETETDIFPSTGWLDGRGAENGDKCAWISSGQGASASVSLNGTSYPMQSLWSNAFNGGAGGCVQSYP